MNTNRKVAIIAGVLFIIATVVDLLSLPFLKSVSSSDYLTQISANQNQVLIGALFLIIAAFACAGIVVTLFPVLRKYNEGLALGSVIFRTIEAIFYTISAVGVLLLLTLSQEFVKAGANSGSYFQTFGKLLLAARDYSSLAGILAFYLGGLMYYVIFLKSKLIPSWLSIWGIVGVLMGMLAALLVMFHVAGTMSTTQIVLNLPIAVQEMVLAIWLIVKGFNSSEKLDRTSN
jgi:hypothetical protein